MPSKPDRLRLVTREFKTPAQRAATRDLLLLWPEHKSFAEISRRSGWSEPHLRSVFDRYLEPVQDDGEASSPLEADIVDEWPVPDTDAYREGYRDGFRDGLADGKQQSGHD